MEEHLELVEVMMMVKVRMYLYLPVTSFEVI